MPRHLLKIFPRHDSRLEPRFWSAKLLLVVLVLSAFVGGQLLKYERIATVASFPTTGLGLRNPTRLLPEQKVDGAALTGASLPQGFDWEAYKFFNPDLSISKSEQAEAHYMSCGIVEGRLFKRIPLYLTYNATFGLCNQLLSHMGMLAVAAGMNATITLSPAYSRRNFTAAGSVYKREPLETLLDVPRMKEYFTARGQRFSDSREFPGCQAVNVREHFHQKTPFKIDAAIEQIARYISDSVRPILREQPEADACVHVRWGNPFRGILPELKTNFQLVTPAAHGLLFAPEVVARVDAILKAMEAAGQVPFRGVHLRIEDDWKKFFGFDKRHEDLTKLYMEAMREANFTETTPVYFASGIFGQQSEERIQALELRLRRNKVCGAMVYRQKVLPLQDFEGLHSEQLALVDLLVLARAEVVVGDSHSSFSSFLREYRALHGLPKSTFYPAVHKENLVDEWFSFTP